MPAPNWRIANAWEAVCLGAGTGLLEECLRYKLEEQGKRLIVVNGPAGTPEELRDLGLARSA